MNIKAQELEAQEQELEAEVMRQQSLLFSGLFQPGGEAVVHIDPSPLRQAIRTHFKNYAGVTEADGNSK